MRQPSCLVPKFHLGTHLRAQLHCGGGRWRSASLPNSIPAMELPGQWRSQIPFGNERRRLARKVRQEENLFHAKTPSRKGKKRRGSQLFALSFAPLRLCVFARDTHPPGMQANSRGLSEATPPVVQIQRLTPEQGVAAPRRVLLFSLLPPLMGCIRLPINPGVSLCSTPGYSL